MKIILLRSASPVVKILPTCARTWLLLTFGAWETYPSLHKKQTRLALLRSRALHEGGWVCGIEDDQFNRTKRFQNNLSKRIILLFLCYSVLRERILMKKKLASGGNTMLRSQTAKSIISIRTSNDTSVNTVNYHL